MAGKFKRTIAIALAALSIASLTACGGGSDEDDDYIQGVSAGKELTQTAAADDIFTLNCDKGYTFNPIRATNISNQLVCGFVYENMLDVDNSYNLKKGIITDWSTDDGGKTWVFTVAPDRVFHSGQKVTATDVAYSLQCATNSERFSNRFGYVAGVTADDSHTFTVTLNKQNMQFPMLMTVPVIRYGSGNDTYPDGTGPYTYAGDFNSLVAFKKHPNSATLPIGTIYLKEYDSIDETMAAYEDSLIDMVLNDPSAGANLGYGNANAIRSFNTTNMHYVGINIYSPEMENDAIRAAMNYAFDREYIVNQLAGYASEAVFPINQASWMYNKNLAQQYNYNLKKVQEILSGAGIKDFDGDGFLEMPYGDSHAEINLNFVVFGESAAKVNMAQHFAGEMEKLGIKVTVTKLGWDEYNAALANGVFDLYYAEVKLNPDFDPTKLLMSGGELNYGHVSDSELDNAITTFLTASDAERKAAAESLCVYIANNAYIVPLCFERHQLISHRGTVEGIKANENSPVGNSYDWTIKFENVDTSAKDDGEKK